MPFERYITRAFRMDEATWARHASPWSVWTRNSVLPLFVMALWSRDWIGWWSLLPVTAVLFWAWYNPRAFSPPAHTDNWASKAVFGERVWIARQTIPIPAHHARAAIVLALVSATGLPFLAYGLYALAIWPTLLGMALVMLGKLWFVDRMVWLYEDMKNADPRYLGWLKPRD